MSFPASVASRSDRAANQLSAAPSSPPSKCGSSRCAIVSICMFLQSKAACVSHVASCAPRRVYNTLRPILSSAWFGLFHIASDAHAAATRSARVASAAASTSISPPTPFAYARAACDVASAASALTASSASVSAGVGSRGSAPATTSRASRYRVIRSVARVLPLDDGSAGPRIPFESRRSRHEPPHEPSCARIASAATARRNFLFAGSSELAAAAAEAAASDARRSRTAAAASASVSSKRREYGARSFAQLVQYPNSRQYFIIAAGSDSSSDAPAGGGDVVVVDDDPLSCDFRYANSTSRRYGPRPTFIAPPASSAAATSSRTSVSPLSTPSPSGDVSAIAPTRLATSSLSPSPPPPRTPSAVNASSGAQSPPALAGAFLGAAATVPRMVRSIAQLAACQSSGISFRTPRQCASASSTSPSSAACVAHSESRSAFIGTHFSASALSSSVRASRPLPHSRNTLAHTSSVSRSVTPPFFSSFAHIPAASRVSVASLLSSRVIPLVWRRMPHTAHMTCFGSFVSLYSFIAHCCCFTNAKSRACAENKSDRCSRFFGSRALAASNIDTIEDGIPALR
mmetsp:Transcript_4189/g.14719  ORF Transcript_4189/g.14719 Transcript_4189/m.14719 type:complete len:573 (-) Transcript_4189:327-2045(-)